MINAAHSADRPEPLLFFRTLLLILALFWGPALWIES
eukprot:COSAG02_NODE_8480_length_2555_cov_2.345277_2_plen_37_part_00